MTSITFDEKEIKAIIKQYDKLQMELWNLKDLLCIQRMRCKS